ncbi:MAG TPA: CoA-transferase [Acidobacteriota bacterium]|nr:CoA-transferase [Acidobacteriota bacterium]
MSDKIEIPDLMICAMASEIENFDTVLHGVSSPLPILAMSVARKTHAPDMAYISGAEGVDPEIDRVYPSSFDGRLNRNSVAYFGLHEAFDLAQRGEINVMFLGAAQVDRFGNTNLSVIGDIDRPKVRLPGGAASAFMMPLTPKVVIWVTRHNKRVLVEEVDFVTGQGYNHRAEEYKKNEIVVVSNLGVMNFRNPERLMQIQSYHPGHTIDEIRDNTGFDITPAPGVTETPVPGAEIINLIHNMDPDNVRWTEFH